jgi:secreted Zn-dependent insulinase-like peptidase
MADTLMGQDCPADRLDPDIVKSPNDKKSYRHFKLANGVTVLLIHDPAVAAGLATDATQVGPPPTPPPYPSQ